MAQRPTGIRGEPVPWWQTGILYEIYSRSYQDSNGDGIGDLRGIRQRLPYLVELGIDAVWLSPIYASPMLDFGYDVADHTAIDPVFGSLIDFDELLTEAHEHGLKIILDLVPNHTSDQHTWFKESCASRKNPKRDWYIWHDPAAGGQTPNNWLSEFGGSAWQYDPTTSQFYYHAFLAAQPDLNWRNPQVRSAIYDVMRFWLRRGVDGFRVDVIWHLIKDDRFRDNPINPDYRPPDPPHHAVVPLYTQDRPEVQDVVREMRGVVDEFSDRVLIGEIYLPLERLVAYYGQNLSGVHLPFNFSLLTAPWHARPVARLVEEYEAALPPGGWPDWVLGNHDRPRVATRVGEAQARVAAMLLLTLRGTPTIYYGDEIGMGQAALPADRVRDPLETNVPGLGLGRDGCRTPMQWNEIQNAGFSSAKPWLPVADSFREVNVATQRNDATSIFQLYRRLIQLRRNHRALSLGTYRPLRAGGDLLLFLRERDGSRVLVALNLGIEPISVRLPDNLAHGHLLLSRFLDRSGEELLSALDLRPNEGMLVDISAADDGARPGTPP